MSKAKVKARRAGFVAIIGRPNAGKSTLLNRFVGQKVAIVTAKPQTTRNRIQGMVTNREGQIVFIDTPGLHEADTVLNRQMMREVAAALEGIDLLRYDEQGLIDLLGDRDKLTGKLDAIFARDGDALCPLVRYPAAAE